MRNQDKVGSITKENYKDVVGRASEVREKLKAHYKKHQGFPSLRYVIIKWGFNMSLKALCRHRKVVMEELGITDVGKPTHVLPRPKRKKPTTTEPATLKESTPARKSTKSTEK